MSYHNNLANGKKPEIEMPPLPQENSSEKKQYEMHPELQNALPHEAQQVEESEEVVENQTQNEEVVVKNPPSTAETPAAKSFRELREQKQRVERERDELARRFQEMETKRQQPIIKDEEDVNVGNDDIVEGKHLSKYDRKIKKLQEELSQYQQQSNVTATEVRLRNQYPDFDKVVSKDNIEILRSSYPEVAETINNSSTDLYSKAVSAYTLIKKLGITVEDIYVEDKQKAIKNAAKPRPLASVNPQQGESPLARANAFANGLTEDLKKQLHQEMLQAMKNK